MNKVAIITDSTCDLSEEIISQNNIDIIPLYVNFGDESYLDLIEMNGEKLFKKVKETNIHPKSSAPSPITFHEKFAKYIDEGYDILYLGIGADFSGTFQIAYTASLEFPKERIYLVDSQNLSSGIGLLIMKAIKFRDEGLSAKEIAQKLEEIAPRVRTQFVINTLDYLHNGGRCSGTARIVGSILKLHPIIRVVDGGMIVAKKPRGTLNKGIDVMLEYLEKDLGNIDKDCVFITHAAAPNEEVYIREKITPLLEGANIIETKAGSVISTHCGPQTIGVLYIVNE